ncbi:DNA gyrase inhibitor YacG, partial [Acinetobacter baumannii]
PEFRPFCSRRCADVDLQRWFTGRYVIPGPPAGEEDDD